MTSLELRNVHVRFDDGIDAVNGLDLRVESGERMVMVGSSGCGKTTTLRVLAGLVGPTLGSVFFDGVDMSGTPPEQRNTAMVFQDHELFPFRTVAENVRYGLDVRRTAKNERSQRVADALESVRLAGFGDRWPTELSGGQRKRVAIARALVIRPNVLLLDEPLGSLERGLREELQQMICQLQEDARITTVMVTHDQDEARAFADRIAVVVEGKIRQVGSIDELLSSPADEDVQRLFAPPHREAL